MAFEKLTEADLADMTEEEREGYLEELAAYTDGSADTGNKSDDDADTERKAEANDANAGEPGDDTGGDVDLDKELNEQENLGAEDLDAGKEPNTDPNADADANASDGAEAGEPDPDEDDELDDFEALPDLGDPRQQIEAQQDLKMDLAQKFDDGEITATEKAAKEREIDSKIFDLQSDLLQRQNTVKQARTDWEKKLVPDFLKDNPTYKPGSSFIKLLNVHVKDLQVNQYASNPFHPNVLKAAHRKLVKELGPEAFGQKPAVPDPKKDTGSGKQGKQRQMPPSLRNVPAAVTEDLSGDASEFAYLDRLADKDIEKFEEELAKLKPAELDRYMNS